MNPPIVRWNVRAIMTGVLTDVGASLLTGVVLQVLAGLIMSSHGISTAQLPKALDELARTHPIFAVAALGCSALGGYVAARSTPGRELSHGLATGCTSLLLSLPFLLFAGTQVSAHDWIVAALTPPVALAGSWWQRLSRKNTAPGGSSPTDDTPPNSHPPIPPPY